MDPAEGTLEVVERPDGVFEVSGQLDLGNASLFRNAIRSAVEPGARIVLDFRAVTFMDSSGLQALVTVASDVAPGGVTIRGVHGSPLTVLSLTGLLDIAGLHVEPLAEAEG